MITEGFGDGGGAAYGEVSQRCVCGALVTVQVNTDGNGGLVETPDKCRSCGLRARPRRIGRQLKAPPCPLGDRVLRCDACGEEFARMLQAGRLLQLCPGCSTGLCSTGP